MLGFLEGRNNDFIINTSELNTNLEAVNGIRDAMRDIVEGTTEWKEIVEAKDGTPGKNVPEYLYKKEAYRLPQPIQEQILNSSVSTDMQKPIIIVAVQDVVNKNAFSAVYVDDKTEKHQLFKTI